MVGPPLIMSLKLAICFFQAVDFDGNDHGEWPPDDIMLKTKYCESGDHCATAT